MYLLVMKIDCLTVCDCLIVCDVQVRRVGQNVMVIWLNGEECEPWQKSEWVRGKEEGARRERE